ncbi:MAG TPA: hypothetical protein VF678_09775 [bacterium]
MPLPAPKPYPDNTPASAEAQAAVGAGDLRPLSRKWRWAIAGYAAVVLIGLAGAMLMSGAPGSGKVSELVALLQQPYLQLLDGYRGQDEISPDVEYVVYESESEADQGLRAYLNGRQDMQYVSKGLLPGVSVVRIRKEQLQASLTSLRQQPFVNLALKARVGMICH